MLQSYDPIELSQNPYWMELIELYTSLKKMLPQEYIETMGSEAILPSMYDETGKTDAV